MEPKALNALLPFVLKRDNVARYEDGVVYIGDRLKYPFEKTFVRCEDVGDVARAIEEMVTQGGGPYVAAAFAMVMASRKVAGKPLEETFDYLRKAKTRLTNTRPTNTAMARRLDDIMKIAENAGNQGQSIEQVLLDWIRETRDKAYADYEVRGRLGASLVDDGDGILTMCFAETAFILAMAFAKQDGKKIQVFTPETRPYLQGARLTAPSLHELDIPVQIITDNMPAYVMSQGKIQKYFTAADLITLDGHICNKIGTFQNAIAAHHHGIPYFVFMWGADYKSLDRDSIEIEYRNPAEIRACRGVPTTIDDIDAYYPAFDITPPFMVSGVITRYGILSPYDLKRHFTEA
ncbi:MAG: s-methyl-5-thioribose-1-phosphate isomerase [Deltaproteobacteria bacterium]|nr:s-methyl-5-thioribose-1-phosphate isomerase [Deltaproteobacteria bacterium]